MQPVLISAADVSHWVAQMWWPALRVSGFVAAAPLVSGSMVPSRVKIVLTLALTLVLAPSAVAPTDVSIFSAAGFVAAAREMLIGVAIGMVVQLAFEALTFAGQALSMTMGLGFATLVDPTHGANTTVLGQMFMMFGILTYLAINGHLLLIGALANSFQTLPIGAANIDKGFLLAVATWGGRVFETGLLVALPAMIALVMVNMALGVITRAAPQLNLFGVGFTISVLGGFFILIAGLDGVMAGILDLINGALAAVTDLVAGRAAGAH